MMILASCAITRMKPVSYEIAPNRKKDKGDAVVLIHGLGRSGFSMYFLGNYLSSNGYRVYIYDYPSTRFTVEEHTIKLVDFIKTMESDSQIKKIHYVTHSMGGIVARKALAGNVTNKTGKLVMLAPPNKGSEQATLACKIPLMPTILLPLIELTSEKNSPINYIPVPNIDIGIISGKYDRKAKISETYLKEAKAYLIINSSHTFIMNKSKTKSAVLRFISEGDFGSDTILH